jgi:hypothetical protein
MNGSEEDLSAFWPTALNILKKINFRVYNKDEIVYKRIHIISTAM